MNSKSTKATPPLRVGLLGAGVIATTHALALQTLPQVQLVAVCDRDLPKAKLLQDTWNIPECFDNLESMLSEAGLDVAHILLPPPAHAEMAIRCLDQGLHVFVEKPFCVSAKECRAVAAAAGQMGRKIGVNHNVTYMPGVLRLIDELRQFRLGAVEHVTVSYALPMPAIAAGQHGHWMFGGMERLILELGPHPLSVIYRLVGEFQRVATTVSGHTVLTNGQSFYDTWQSSLVCERGTAQLHLAVGGSYVNIWVHVLGQDGEAFVDLRRNTFRISEKTRYMRMNNLVDGWRNSRLVLGSSLKNFWRYALGAAGLQPTFELQNISMRASLQAFYESLVAGVEPPVGAEEGTAVIQACEAIVRDAGRFLDEAGVHQNVLHR